MFVYIYTCIYIKKGVFDISNSVKAALGNVKRTSACVYTVVPSTGKSVKSG